MNVVRDKIVYTAGHPVSEVPEDLPAQYYVGELPKFSAYTIRPG